MKPAATTLSFVVYLLMYTLSAKGQSNGRYYFISDRYSNRDSICVVIYIGKSKLENLLVWGKYPRPIEALGTDKSIRYFLLENGFAVISEELVNMPTFGSDLLAQNIAENKDGAWKSSNEYSRQKIKKPTNVSYYWKIVSCDSPNSIIVVDIYKPISGRSKFSIENIKVWREYKNNFVPESKIGSSFKNYLLRNGLAEIIDTTKNTATEDKDAQRQATINKLGLWKYRKQKSKNMSVAHKQEVSTSKIGTGQKLFHDTSSSGFIKLSIDELKKIRIVAFVLRLYPSIETFIRTQVGFVILVLVILIIVGLIFYITLFLDRVKSILREVFYKKARILIVGPIDAGKTTFWRHFANQDSAPPGEENNIKPHIEHLKTISRNMRLLPILPIICEISNINSVPNLQVVPKKFKHGVLLIILRVYENDNKLSDYTKQEQLVKAVLMDISSKKISPSRVFLAINVNPDKSEEKIDIVSLQIEHKDHFAKIIDWFQSSNAIKSYRKPVWLNINNQKEVRNFYHTLFKK